MLNFNKGTNYLNKGNYTKALQFLKREEEICKEKFLNLGNAYKALGDDEKAADCWLKAISNEIPFYNKTFGVYPQALNNLGLLAYCYGRDEEAIKFYTACLEANPLHGDAIWNYSHALLRQCIDGKSNEWDVAWKMYEFRFKRSSPTRVDKSLPMWDGISSGKSICVLSEQGIGDKIMFGRYIHLLKNKFSEVNVQCHKSLNWIFSDYNCSEKAIGDVGIPICSLAGIFNGIPSANWLPAVNVTNTSSKDILICWSGSSTHANDKNRSVGADRFKFLTKYGNVGTINVDNKHVPNWITSISSDGWETTASRLLSCNLLVTVDTSLAHMAGSLGVKTLLLMPLKENDFRWGTIGSECIWYPSVHIVRNYNDWDSVFKRVEEYVKAL